MNETLVGIVIGAILGGGAQVLNAWLVSRRERRRLLREERRTIYTDLVIASHAAFKPDEGARRDKQERMYALETVVRLIAPVDTWRAAREMVLAVQRGEPNQSELARVETEFVRLAQRDLGNDTASPTTGTITNRSE